MMLTDEERKRFASYLDESVESDMVMIEQLKLMGGHELKIKKINTEAMAAKIIAMKLRSIEAG